MRDLLIVVLHRSEKDLWITFHLLHMNGSQHIRQRRDENDREANRREETDEKAIDAFIAEFRGLLHFVLDPLDPDSHHDEDAGRKGRDRQRCLRQPAHTPFCRKRYCGYSHFDLSYDCPPVEY